MPIDNKYGHVSTEFGTIGEDEPVIVFRAQDQLLPALLGFYKLMCESAGSPPHHLDLIDESRGQILEWQQENRDWVRMPNSNAYMDRTSG